MPLEGCLGLEDRVGGAALFGLKDELHALRPRGQGLPHPVGLVADDQKGALEAKTPAEFQDVGRHGQAVQGMEDLDQVGTHPGSLAGGHDDGAQVSHRGFVSRLLRR
jgi:hypothetical protein